MQVIENAGKNKCAHMPVTPELGSEVVVPRGSLAQAKYPASGSVRTNIYIYIYIHDVLLWSSHMPAHTHTYTNTHNMNLKGSEAVSLCSALLCL